MENYNAVSEKENPLFKRKEIVFTVVNATTPSNKEIEEFVSQQFGTSSDKFKVQKIEGRFGSQEFTVSVNIYESDGDKNKTEFKSKKEIEEEKKAAEEAAAKKAEEEAAEAEKQIAEEKDSEETKKEEKSE